MINVVRVQNDPPEIVLSPVFGFPEDSSGITRGLNSGFNPHLSYNVRTDKYTHRSISYQNDLLYNYNSASIVMENSKAGTFVSWLRIKNRSSSNDLTITLSPGQFFKLESDVIVTTKSFDREKKSQFDLVVTVCESGLKMHRFVNFRKLKFRVFSVKYP